MCGRVKLSRPPAALFNCSFNFYRRPHIPETETLKQFRRVEKYANEAETVSVFYFSFYRAMHFSAKRGIAIACRLSVRL